MERSTTKKRSPELASIALTKLFPSGPEPSDVSASVMDNPVRLEDNQRFSDWSLNSE